MIFSDTNVFVYAFSADLKRVAAQRILADGGVISTQVLNEFTSVMRTKARRSWEEIERALSLILRHFPKVGPLTLETHAAAVVLARDHSLAVYDALILAAAIEAGCETLYSEDFQHGRRFGALTIVNPFLAHAGS
jgi:predicted nucleic acid-binding protein